MTVTNSPLAAPDAAHASLLAATDAIVERVAATADACEAARKLLPEAVDLMAGAGLWRILTPRCYGGSELSLRAQVDTVMVMAQAYGAAGWVQMVINAHAFLAGSFPQACQDEVFAGGPDTRIPGTLATQGHAIKVDGGWKLRGRWQFASGVDVGEWLMIGARADELPGSPNTALHVIVPKADVVVDDTWHTLGLRGTGSKDLVAEDVFVPEHRSLPTALLMSGRSPHGERHPTGLYRLPLVSSLSLQMSSAAVGIARAAWEVYVERTRERREVYTGQAKRDSAGTQMRIAESRAELTAAELMVKRAAEDCDATVASGAHLEIEQRMTSKWHAAYAVELARRATDRLYSAAGAHAVYNDSTMQRSYRDVNTACHHAIVDFDTTAQGYGQMELGFPVAGMV